MDAGMIPRVVKGKRYWMMPSIDVGYCTYCEFNNTDPQGGCTLVENYDNGGNSRYPDSHHIGCNPEDLSVDYIFIKRTKAALAEYVAHKLEGA
jgi:hypothetical protein